MKRRVLILGTSFGGRVQAPAFSRHPGFEVVGMAGTDAARTKSIADELGVPRASADWRALLAELRPDLVSIATPVDLHHPMMLAALEAGAHVLCEKPTALHVHQAVEMRDRAKALGRVAAINHEFRFFPARRAALALVRAGGIGRPRRGEILGRYPIWHRARVARHDLAVRRAPRRRRPRRARLAPHRLPAHVLRRAARGRSPRCASTSPGAARDRSTAGGARATADDACTVQLRVRGRRHRPSSTSRLHAVPLGAVRDPRRGGVAALGRDRLRLWRIVAGRDPEPVEIPAELRLEPREGDLRAGRAVRRAGRSAASRARGPRADAAELRRRRRGAGALDAARASSAAGTGSASRTPRSRPPAESGAPAAAGACARLDPLSGPWLYSCSSRAARAYAAPRRRSSYRPREGRRMADWDVIAKQRLTEDWATLRAAYLPLNQAMRRTVEFLEKDAGTFAEVADRGARAARGQPQEPQRALRPALALGAARGDPQPARAGHRPARRGQRRPAGAAALPVRARRAADQRVEGRADRGARLART